MVSIGGERDLASRMRRERVARGMTYRALAEAMAGEGCDIQPSALQRIESGYPRKPGEPEKRPRIGVDALAAMCRVFDLSPDDLLTPIELVGKAQAERLLESAIEAVRGLWASGEDLYDAARELGRLAIDEEAEDIAYFVINRIGLVGAAPRDVVPMDVVAVLRPALMGLLRRGLYSHLPTSPEGSVLDEAQAVRAWADRRWNEAVRSGDPAQIKKAKEERELVVALTDDLVQGGGTR